MGEGAGGHGRDFGEDVRGLGDEESRAQKVADAMHFAQQKNEFERTRQENDRELERLQALLDSRAAKLQQELEQGEQGMEHEEVECAQSRSDSSEGRLRGPVHLCLQVGTEGEGQVLDRLR